MKFYTVALGPILFETRFKHFLNKNKNILDHYTWVVDNYNLYEPYKDEVKIIDIDSIRKNHSWSKEYELLFNEKDPVLFAKNFNKVCEENKQYLPLDLQRFALLEFYKEETLNFCYIGSNVQITNNKEHILEFFNKIPQGTFLAPFWSNIPEPCSVTEHIKDDLQAIYPQLKITNTRFKFDGWGYGMHFRSKEDLLLFYNLWESILEIYYKKTNLENIILGASGGVTNYELAIGWVMNIFTENFNYDFKNIHEFWTTDKLGVHLSLIHDTWFYGGIRCGWTHFGFVLDEKIKTVADFIARNQEPIKVFYDRYNHILDYKILVDNVELRYKF